MISETTSQKAMEAAELGFIPGMKIPDVPYQVDKWQLPDAVTTDFRVARPRLFSVPSPHVRGCIGHHPDRIRPSELAIGR
jgi:hypothetical protein